MRFLSIYRPSPKNVGKPPSKELMENMEKLIQKSFASGELVATGGLTPGRTYVRRSGDEVTVVDGPFAEAKELIAGFALMEAKDKADVVRMAREFLAVAGDGECELHGIMGEPPKGQ